MINNGRGGEKKKNGSSAALVELVGCIRCLILYIYLPFTFKRHSFSPLSSPGCLFSIGFMFMPTYIFIIPN